MGDIGNIKENSPGYNRMLEKYQAQERKNIERVLAAKGASSIEELVEIEKKTISEQTSSRRNQEGFVELKDRTIKADPKSQEIINLRKEIESVALSALPHVSSQDQASASSLKDRVQQGPLKGKAG